MNALIRYLAKQHIFSDLITVFVILVGIISLFLIRREVFPNVSFDVITITTVTPGTSPEAY
tara:strand:- start:36 stop:218 length:183 start_codon:yes stop_codon:yes gene_type:complete